jgi:hypothetical protein
VVGCCTIHISDWLYHNVTPQNLDAVADALPAGFPTSAAILLLRICQICLSLFGYHLDQLCRTKPVLLISGSNISAETDIRFGMGSQTKTSIMSCYLPNIHVPVITKPQERQPLERNGIKKAVTPFSHVASHIIKTDSNFPNRCNHTRALAGKSSGLKSRSSASVAPPDMELISSFSFIARPLSSARPV